MPRIICLLTLAFVLISFTAKAQRGIAIDSQMVAQKLLVAPVPRNFYTRNLGFFCKREIEIQKGSALNLFIRLGSKEYVDYLERKPNNIYRYSMRN